MKKFLEKLGVLILGLIIVILLLELGLRIIGWVYYQKSHSDIRRSKSGAYTVLCLGDSYTYGVGAPPEQSYPKQLERMLNAAQSGKEFIVVNRGQGGQNTTQLLRQLPSNLDTVKPDMVVLMTGVANLWNFYALKDFQQQNKWAAGLQNLAYRVRIYKLIKLLTLNLNKKFEDYRKIKEKEWIAQVAKSSNLTVAKRYYETAANPEASKCFDAGMTALGQKNYAAALEQFTRGIALDSKYSRNYNGVADVYEAQKNFPQAIVWYQKAISINPSRGDNYLRLGRIYLNTKEFDKAAENFTKSSALDPQNGESIKGLGDIYTEKREYDKAKDYYKKAAMFDSRALYGLAKVYEELQDYPEAIKWFKQALELNPRDTDRYQELAGLFHKSQNYNAALSFYSQALAANPGDGHIYVALGDTYRNLHNFPQAVLQYKQALALNPQNGVNYYTLGRVYLELEDYNEAIRWFEDGTKHDPRCSQNFAGMGESCLSLNQLDQAIVWYRKAIALDPIQFGYYFNLGLCYHRKGDAQEALKWYKKAVAVNPRESYAVVGKIEEVYRGVRPYQPAKTVPQRSPQFYADPTRKPEPLKPKAQDAKPLNELKLSREFKPGAAAFVKELYMDPDRKTAALKAWISHDLRSIIEQCQARGLKVILQIYPTGFVVNNQECEYLFTDLAQTYKIPLVNNEEVFNKLVDLSAYFEPDGHCNAKGYGIVAHNVCQAVLQLLQQDYRP